MRNVTPIKINEFRVSDGTTANSTNAFIELYNAGASDVDISDWTLTEHPTQQAVFSAVKIPARNEARGARLLPARPLDLRTGGPGARGRHGHQREEHGRHARRRFDQIDTGAGAETRTIARIGTAAGSSTTVWQPLPDGPVITIPAGATTVPVTSVAGFAVGEKIALGYGATLSRRLARTRALRGRDGDRGRQARHAGVPWGGRVAGAHQH